MIITTLQKSLILFRKNGLKRVNSNFQSQNYNEKKQNI